MSNWDNGNHGGPSFPLWKVILVILAALGAACLYALIVFPEGGTP